MWWIQVTGQIYKFSFNSGYVSLTLTSVKVCAKQCIHLKIQEMALKSNCDGMQTEGDSIRKISRHKKSVLRLHPWIS